MRSPLPLKPVPEIWRAYIVTATLMPFVILLSKLSCSAMVNCAGFDATLSFFAAPSSFEYAVLTTPSRMVIVFVTARGVFVPVHAASEQRFPVTTYVPADVNELDNGIALAMVVLVIGS